MEIEKNFWYGECGAHNNFQTIQKILPKIYPGRFVDPLGEKNSLIGWTLRSQPKTSARAHLCESRFSEFSDNCQNFQTNWNCLTTYSVFPKLQTSLFVA